MFHKNILYCVSQIEATFKGPENKFPCCMGTGFWISSEKDVYLITNRHMFDPNYVKEFKSCPEKYKLQSVRVGLHGCDNLTNAFLPQYDFHEIENVDSILRYHDNPGNDLAVVQINREFPKPFNFFRIKINNLALTEDFETMFEVGDDIVFIGYPNSWHDAKNNLPIMRGGFISSLPHTDYGDAEGKVTGNCLAIEATSFGGSSGSPVITRPKGILPGGDIEDPSYVPGKIIGVNGGHHRYKKYDDKGDLIHREHSGISYLYKSTAILEIIRSFKSK